MDASGEGDPPGSRGSAGASSSAYVAPTSAGSAGLGLTGTLEASLVGLPPPLPLSAAVPLGSYAEPMERMPWGWAGQQADEKLRREWVPSRGGLFDDERLIGNLAEASSTQSTSLAGLGATQSEFFRGSSAPQSSPPQSSPQAGFMSSDEFPRGPLNLVHAPETLPEGKRPESPLLAYVDRAAFPGFVDPDEYEGSLRQAARDQEWTQVSIWRPAAGASSAAAPTSTERAIPVDSAESDAAWEAELREWKRRYGCPDDGDAEGEEATAGVAPGVAASAAPPVQAEDTTRAVAPLADEPQQRSLGMEQVLRTEPCVAAEPVVPVAEAPPQSALPEAVGLAGEEPRRSDAATSAELPMTTLAAVPPLPPPALPPPALPPAPEAAVAEDLAVPAVAAEPGPSPGQVVAEWPSPALPRPPSAGAGGVVRPASGGRRYVYTQEDLEVATQEARSRLEPGGNWKSGYTEGSLQKRDFFLDLRNKREREKGRQATGPLWLHLSTQAKNLANTFDLPELLEAMKLFCSVRYDDYELYMRLLGEVPHYIKQANADQLCELIRLLARRRLRERNYVDMVAAHMLQKIRGTDDALPARLLVKTANAFAALECRSQPRFVEHFLRHMEHRIEELDADLCCLVSTLFVVNYMGDSLRRAYLKRCAETQAGFQGPTYELRNLACTELAIRKEHHSFAVSLPAYVGRFLEKVRQHAQFDKWGSVVLPPAVAPDGPKGSQRADMSVSLLRKASTATGGQRGDVFNSDMHRDVSACLTHLGIEHENGVLCGPYLLDVVALDMVNPHRRIVYEVNSPHHYYEGTQALTAEKRLRHRMLVRLGHKKLHMVNAEDWRLLTAAQKMTFLLKLQQETQEENSKEASQQAAANTMRAPLPSIRMDTVKEAEPFKLKSVRDLKAPIRVPVPPSQRGRAALMATA